MVAVAQAPPAPHASRRHLVVVGSAPAVRPRSGVAPVPASIYRRRRLVAGLLVVGVTAALVLALQALLPALGAGPLTGSERPAAGVPVHVVQPGDTFWDIARALRPNEDPRPLVARLVAAHGSPVLVVGERIPLPTGP